ncbi:MAG: DUF1488 domain-containing protein [Planctomycetes bacterium]|nr:DUF1488 domain-containing protein [Planctomycetota bacterium]
MPPKEIVFPDVPPPSYLDERDCISFPAWADGKPVNCVVTAELLMQRFGLRTLDGEAMLEAYRQNRESIQGHARFYIEMGWIDPDHEVLLTRLLTTVRVSYGAALRGWGGGFRLTENASRRLTEMIGPMAGEVSFEWDRAEGPSRDPVITLKISNPFGSVSAAFDPSEMESPSHMQGRLARLWGDLLQIQSRKQLGQLLSGRIEG